MSKHPVNLTGLLVGAGCLTLNGALNAQIVRSLPETRVTASQSGGAGEGDLDETTLSPEDLERFGVETLEDLSMLAPNLHFVDSDTRGYGNIISMRGLSNTLFFGPAAVGLYVDDVPFGDAFNYSSNLLRLESARVHHGPQGASFGRNASAGLMELSTMQTTDTWKLGGSVEYGSYNSRAVTGYSSGPLADGLSHTFQFYWKERDGFVENNFLGGHADDRSVLGGLASIIWTPAPDTEIKFRVMAERVDDGSQRLTPLPFNPAFAGDLFRVNSDLRGRNETERYQLSLHGRKDFDWGTMKSITSYQSWDLGPQTVDLDLSPGSFATSLINQDQDLWTQEFRFQSSEDAGPLSWRGGLFYMNKENNGSTRRMFPAGLAGIVTEGNRFTIEEKNYAAYGKAAYDLGNGFSVEAGGRLDYTDASMSRVKTLAPFGPVPAQSPNSEGIYFSPTTGIVYAHNDNVSSFLRTGMGIKPHGYSAFSDDPATASFGEERNWSNEAGVHYNDPDSNLNVVVRAFWNVIDDYQPQCPESIFDGFCDRECRRSAFAGLGSRTPVAANRSSAHSRKCRLDRRPSSSPTPIPSRGRITMAAMCPSFRSSPRAPVSATTFRAASSLDPSVRATEDTYYDAANTGAFLQDGYWIWDAQAGYEAENWSVTVYGRNILDEEYYSFINPQIAAGSPGDPQLFGVRVNLDLW